ncbi:MAG: xanthine phosphoribosyltransferase [Alphaproteobacteria bacterium]|nr:xanthine phosphoribosyltransferase [Alphaproteobacteria bacterium]
MTDAQTQKYFPVSWDDMHRSAKALAWKLHDIGHWKGLIAITRGGLVPAAIIARELEIRVIETVSVVSRAASDGSASGQHEETVILKHPANVGDGEGWLVIDDLVDTGRTIEVLRRMLPKAYFAAVYAKPQGMPLIDSFVTEVSQDTWIFLPWDGEMQISQPIAQQRKTPPGT